MVRHRVEAWYRMVLGEKQFATHIDRATHQMKHWDKSCNFLDGKRHHICAFHMTEALSKPMYKCGLYQYSKHDHIYALSNSFASGTFCRTERHQHDQKGLYMVLHDPWLHTDSELLSFGGKEGNLFHGKVRNKNDLLQ